MVPSPLGRSKFLRLITEKISPKCIQTLASLTLGFNLVLEMREKPISSAQIFQAQL